MISQWFKVSLFSLILLSQGCCAKKPETHNTTPVVASSEPEVESPAKTAAENLIAKTKATATFAEARDLAVPLVVDHDINDHSLGHSVLTLWAETHEPLFKFDVVKNKFADDTEVALIKKNPRKEAGKRFCTMGKIIEIKEDDNRSDGLLLTLEKEVVSFTNIGSSGNLIEGKVALMCGVSTGTFSYANSKGGTTHAVSVVGVWDLPENK